MGTGRYESITNQDAFLVEPGYVNAWISLLSDFNDIQAPILGDIPDIGDSFIIKNSHDWVTGKEPISLLVKHDAVENNGDSVGDIGGGRMVFKPKLFLEGDGAAAEEVLDNLLNEKVILFISEMPWNGTFIQFGSAAIPCEIERDNSKSSDLLNGSKGTELVIRAFNKFFYKGYIPSIDSIFPIHILNDEGFELETESGQSIIL